MGIGGNSCFPPIHFVAGIAPSYTDNPSAGDVQVAPRTIAKNVAFRSAAERLLLVTVWLNTAGGNC